jgi:eukaryotic-like serine/threonine-protein kinase
MDQERWKRVQEIFYQASERAPEQHRAFVAAACAGDEALAREVLALLEEAQSAASSIELDVGPVVEQLLHAGAASPPMRRIGPYRLDRLLGEGGMGVVYLATREDLDTQVAIKVLRDGWVSPARQERFLAEQRMLARLAHPNIATLHDAQTLPDGTPCFVMEYVEGAPLTEYCRERDLRLVERLRLLRQVCEAVRYSHQRLIVHRDLKPSNILVTASGSVKLLDFGIARSLEALEGLSDQTGTLLRLLTPAYAAPEQVRGEPVDVRSDVYSLGVVLYELLAGRRPFQASLRTPPGTEPAVVRRDPEKPSHAAQGTSGAVEASRAAWADLDAICLTAMQAERDRRYATVDALARDLDHFLAGQPLDARPYGFAYRSRKFLGRHRRALAAVATAAILVAGLVVFFAVRLATARDAAVAALQRSERVERFVLNLFRGGDESTAGPAEDLRVMALVERGVQEADLLHAEPAVQADLYVTLGGIYQRLGSLDRAESLLTGALDRRRELGAAGRAGIAEGLTALGLLRVEQARFEEAERLVREGLGLARRLDPRDDPLVARAAAALGKVFEMRGDYEAAIPPLEEALRLRWSAGGPTIELSRTLSQLANVYYYVGRFDESEQLNRRVIAMDRQLFGDRHPYVSDGLVNLGAIRYERGDHVEAERYHREALAITEAWYGPDHPKTAGNLSMLGRALAAQERDDEALAVASRALEIRERVFGPDHPRVATVLGDLSQLALRRGEPNEAVAIQERMIRIYRAAYDDRHAHIAMALAGLARIQLARGDYSGAEEAARDAVHRFLDTLPAEHPRTTAARIVLGSALVGQGRFEEAKEHTRAAYDLLASQPDPQPAALRRARQDLAAIYEGLGRREDAEAVRERLAADAAPDNVTSTKTPDR